MLADSGTFAFELEEFGTGGALSSLNIWFSGGTAPSQGLAVQRHLSDARLDFAPSGREAYLLFIGIAPQNCLGDVPGKNVILLLRESVWRKGVQVRHVN